MFDAILKRDGLSIKLFEELSYLSGLGIRLKKNLHYFDKNLLFDELVKVHGAGTQAMSCFMDLPLIIVLKASSQQC